MYEGILLLLLWGFMTILIMIMMIILVPMPQFEETMSPKVLVLVPEDLSYAIDFFF